MARDQFRDFINQSGPRLAQKWQWHWCHSRNLSLELYRRAARLDAPRRNLFQRCAPITKGALAVSALAAAVAITIIVPKAKPMANRGANFLNIFWVQSRYC
jgi:hypothetical protein